MEKEERTPSESEWRIMEVLWESKAPLTSLEVIKRMENADDMTPKMIRVLMNRLSKKGLLGYEVDKKDSRVYHYIPLKTKEECLADKSRQFTDSYFLGNKTNALAALLQSMDLTDEQISELEEILKKSKKHKKR